MVSVDKSLHSHSSDRSKRRPPTWGDSPATDFAITTVNVPDRLDLQEVRAREEEDDYQRTSRFSLDRYTASIWTKRLLTAGVIGGLGWLGWSLVTPVADQMSPTAVAARLSQAVGLPVTISGRSFAIAPQPRMILSGVSIGDKLRLNEVTLQTNWDELLSAAKSGRIAFAEAQVGPIQLSRGQVFDLVSLAPKLASAGGAVVPTVRFTSVEFPDFPLLPRRYEVVLARPTPVTSPVALRELGGGGGMTLRARTADDGAIAFDLEAQQWQAPVGPRYVWSTLSATGTATPSHVVIDGYTAASPMGVVQGAMVAAVDQRWSAAATARSASVDLETLSLRLAGEKPGEPPTRRPTLVGSAQLSLIGGGHGDTLAGAVDAVELAGPVSVKMGTLNGINLGLAATQGLTAETGGGLTRFTELTALADVGEGGLVLRSLEGRAGAMVTRGEIRVSPDLQLSGVVRVDLGATRVQAPASLRVAGTAVAPRFSRP